MCRRLRATQAPLPGACPRANTPQLWNATAFPLAEQTILGLVPIGSLNTLMVDPSLPPWLPEMIQVTLRFGEKRAAVRSGRSCINRGSFTSSARPAPESLSARWAERIAGLIESLSR